MGTVVRVACHSTTRSGCSTSPRFTFIPPDVALKTYESACRFFRDQIGHQTRDAIGLVPHGPVPSGPRDPSPETGRPHHFTLTDFKHSPLSSKDCNWAGICPGSRGKRETSRSISIRCSFAPCFAPFLEVFVSIATCVVRRKNSDRIRRTRL